MRDFCKEYKYEAPDWNVGAQVSLATRSAAYKVSDKFPVAFVEGANDAFIWCENFCTGRWRYLSTPWIIEFENADDASHFVLVWG